MTLKISATARRIKLTERDLQHEHVVPGYAIFINLFQPVVGCHWFHSKHFEPFLIMRIKFEASFDIFGRVLLGRFEPKGHWGATPEYGIKICLSL